MINLQKNDYKQPTQVREWVVQGICEAFLSPCCWSTFHPCNNGMYRNITDYIIKHKGDKEYYGFLDKVFDSDDGVRFNGAEMKQAFQELINAGYYMFQIYSYGSWRGYVCSKKPYYEGGTMVHSFNDFID